MYSDSQDPQQLAQQVAQQQQHEQQQHEQQPVQYEQILESGGHYGAAAAVAASGGAPAATFVGGAFANVAQGLSGQYRNIMMSYWQETINSIERDEHEFKIHQLPLARIKVCFPLFKCYL